MEAEYTVLTQQQATDLQAAVEPKQALAAVKPFASMDDRDAGLLPYSQWGGGMKSYSQGTLIVLS